jgi:hypothetical protein
MKAFQQTLFVRATDSHCVAQYSYDSAVVQMGNMYADGRRQSQSRGKFKA